MTAQIVTNAASPGTARRDGPSRVRSTTIDARRTTRASFVKNQDRKPVNLEPLCDDRVQLGGNSVPAHHEREGGEVEQLRGQQRREPEAEDRTG